MSVPTLEELRRWFDSLDAHQRVCRVWIRTESYSAMCAREAVGIDRLGGKNALVCEGHKPANADWFVRLAKEG